MLAVYEFLIHDLVLKAVNYKQKNRDFLKETLFKKVGYLKFLDVLPPEKNLNHMHGLNFEQIDEIQ